MRIRRTIGALGLTLRGLGGSALWALVWMGAGYFGFYMRPLPALAWMAAVGAACLLYLALLPSMRRRRWAATIGIRGFGPGALWFLVALPASLLVTLLLGTLHLRLLPGYAGAPEVEYANRLLPLGALVSPFFGIVLAPLVEETGFRGLMQGMLARRFGPVIAASIAAAPWALLHLTPPLLLYYLAGAFLCSYARVATRSIWSAVALHLLDNAILMGVPGVLAAFVAWGAHTDLSLLLMSLLASGVVAVGALRASGNAVRQARDRRSRRPAMLLTPVLDAAEVGGGAPRPTAFPDA